MKYKILSMPSYLIGIDYRVHDLNLWLQDGSKDVGVLAICGMGGIGKTTVARHALNLNHGRFDATCFLSNIRDVFEKPYGIISLQRQLVLDISNLPNIEITSIDEGINKIREVTWRKKILLVLDDVQGDDQLLAILGYPIHDLFWEGSKIIITTKNLMRSCRAHDLAYKIHTIEKMDADESLELFSWHAFGQARPTIGFVELSKSVIQQCEGLPLALRVLGSSLLGRCTSVWESELEKLQAIPNNTILKKLKVSYDALQDEHDRNLFLEISCFFVGEDKDHMITILNGCGFHARVGIENLIDRCLLRVDKFNNIAMHDMLRNVGREICRQEEPNNPGKRRRLWHNEDTFNVLEENTGTETIEGIILDMHRQTKVIIFKRHVLEKCMVQPQHNRLRFLSWPLLKYSSNYSEISLKTKAFIRMSKLRLLHINYLEKLKGSYKQFPKKIKWLRWDGYPLKSFPIDFPLEVAISIEMRHSKLRSIWAGRKVFECLKILDLSYSHGLIRIHDFMRFPNLERLILKNCVNLIDVDESIGNLQKTLILLDLKCCTNLRKLPRNIVMLHVLETLIISGCTNLEEFPANMLQNLKSLKRFDANGIIFTNHQEDFFCSCSPTMLDGEVISRSQALMQHYWQSSKMRKTPLLTWNSLPKSLVRISLWGCNLTDDAFPRHFGNLPSLQHLNIGGNPIRCLPECIKYLTNLEEICFAKCDRLRSLIGLPNVDMLYVFDCFALEKITFQSHEGRLKSTTIGGHLKELASMICPVMEFYHYPEATTQTRPIQARAAQRKVISTGVLFFCPGSHVPAWFSHRSIGTSLLATVPSYLHGGTKGENMYSLSICFVYSITNLQDDGGNMHVVLNNKTKGLKLIFGPGCYGYEGSCEEDITSVVHGMVGEDVLVPGDELNVSLLATSLLEIKVKEVGIHFREVRLPQKDRVENIIKEIQVSGKFKGQGCDVGNKALYLRKKLVIERVILEEEDSLL